MDMSDKIKILLAIPKFSDPGISVLFREDKGKQVIFSYNRRGFEAGKSFPRGSAINGEIDIQFIDGKLWQFSYCDFECKNENGLYNADAFIDFLISKGIVT